MDYLSCFQTTSKSLDPASPEQSWVVSSVLGLLSAPRWGASENVAACATVSHVLRAGLSASSSEQQQAALLGELLRGTGYAGRATSSA